MHYFPEQSAQLKAIYGPDSRQDEADTSECWRAIGRSTAVGTAIGTSPPFQGTLLPPRALYCHLGPFTAIEGTYCHLGILTRPLTSNFYHGHPCPSLGQGPEFTLGTASPSLLPRKANDASW